MPTENSSMLDMIPLEDVALDSAAASRRSSPTSSPSSSPSAGRQLHRHASIRSTDPLIYLVRPLPNNLPPLPHHPPALPPSNFPKPSAPMIPFDLRRELANSSFSRTAPHSEFSETVAPAADPPPYDAGPPPPGYMETFGVDVESPAAEKGAKVWGGVVIGIDLMTSLLLLFITLAQLTQNPQSLSTVCVILPFVYVGISVYGRMALSRSQHRSLTAYITLYTLRLFSDAAGLILFILRYQRLVTSGSPSTLPASPTGSATDHDEDEWDEDLADSSGQRKYLAWVLEVARSGVVGMRSAEYAEEQCTRCAWRAGVWSGLFVVHSAFLVFLILHLHIRITRLWQQARNRHFTVCPPIPAPAPPPTTILPLSSAERATSLLNPRRRPSPPLPPLPIERRSTIAAGPAVTRRETSQELIRFDQELFRPRPVQVAAFAVSDEYIPPAVIERAAQLGPRPPRRENPLLSGSDSFNRR
ncbi:hypothetical protein DFS34DRAFT_494409 [Phlyctochytrium arcticum]|nr:hypothetical protein DFS34DRAFT_494409 [Phlyctochytrium arcticum]